MANVITRANLAQFWNNTETLETVAGHYHKDLAHLLSKFLNLNKYNWTTPEGVIYRVHGDHNAQLDIHTTIRAVGPDRHR
ncbi:hypothetical protein Tco_0208653, partial [Tanacetum coccineum]